jgi:hypothetical protein
VPVSAEIGKMVYSTAPTLKLEDISIRKITSHTAFTINSAQIEFIIDNVDPFLSDKLMDQVTRKIKLTDVKIGGIAVPRQIVPHLGLGSLGDKCSISDPASEGIACAKGFECVCGASGRRRQMQKRNLLFGGLQFLCTCQPEKVAPKPFHDCNTILVDNYDPAHKWW